MKIFILSALFITSKILYASDVKDFSSVLMQDVKKDIKGVNEDKFKKANRAPASVGPTPEKKTDSKEDRRIDNMNIRQIGPNKW